MTQGLPHDLFILINGNYIIPNLKMTKSKPKVKPVDE